MIKEKSIEEKYLHLEHRDQILLRPDTYIGNVTTEARCLFVAEVGSDFKDLKIVNKTTKYNPGFFKIIDEILTNASDHYIRTGKVKYIKIYVNNDHISIENDGPGIPVVIHKKEKMYLPEMLFGNTFTSENFDDSIKRTWGGRNGIGAKITNIFSKKFIIETADGKNKYYQEFSDNMSKKTKPSIKKLKKNYTKITFYPDFERFGLTEIDDEIKSVLLRRCIDVAVYCNPVKVYYNDKLISVKNFKEYMTMYINDISELFVEKLDENWEIGITKSINGGFDQVSMVNGISTYKGGSHVNYIINKLTKGSLDILSKKYKGLNIKPNDIKNNIFIFINSKIVNPMFDEQSKETLSGKINGDAPELSDRIIKQFSNSTIIDDVIRLLEIKEHANTKKEVAKSKIKINKLDDAPKAGTSESEKCYLFLTEGDSAQTSVLAGISALNEEREYIGAFPLRGKPLNVRDVNISKIKDNEEVKNIINILGLEFGKKYTDTKKLRYGKVVLMADADCIDENTLVLTKGGYVPIKDITYKDYVFTHNNRWKKVKNIIKSVKTNVVNITINGEIYSFGEDHKLPILRGKEVMLVKTKDILKTDKVLKKKLNIISLLSSVSTILYYILK